MIYIHPRTLAYVGAVLVPVAVAMAQSPGARELQPRTVALDTLRRTAGPKWRRASARHFVVYYEEPIAAGSLKATMDSLERAWDAAATLLGQVVPDAPRASVFVTRSRTRFAGLVSPEAKGLTTRLPSGDDVIILVRNDSVRPYIRHEVMHLVSFRAWGAPGESRAWLAEGLATFADGKCQSTTILAKSRDLLAARPLLGVHDVVENFVPMWRTERAAAYVLAGSLVDYLWFSRGRDGVRRLWTGRDSVTDVGILPGTSGEQTAGWRKHVALAAAGAPALSKKAFQRAGCG
jgi:hypothetical protein